MMSQNLSVLIPNEDYPFGKTWRKHEEAYKKGLTQHIVKHSRYVIIWG